MKVAVIGGTGFIGSYVVEALLNDGHSPILLVQEGNEQKAPRKDECRIVTGHIADEESVRKTISGSEAVIYLIGIIREFRRKGITYEELHFSGAKECMNKAQELGVKRFLLMSANGVKPEGTGYQRTKYLAEQYMKTTDLEYTIFRPSIVYGDPKVRIVLSFALSYVISLFGYSCRPLFFILVFCLMMRASSKCLLSM